MIVTSRKALYCAKAGPALKRAVNYILRPGAGLGGQQPCLFGPEQDGIDRRAFLARCREDPAHYRLVVSPGDNCDLPDLTTYCRGLMRKVGRERGAELDWVAVEHHDTGRPHLHILLRDQTLDGRRLSLPFSFLRSGLSMSAQDLAMELLGPFVEKTPKTKILGKWFTALDHVVVDAAKNGLLIAEDIPEPYRRDVLRRLSCLQTRGWIQSIGPGKWEVPPDLRQRLESSNLRRRREGVALRVVNQSAWRDQGPRLEALSFEPGMEIRGALVGFQRSGLRPQGAQTVVIDTIDGRLGHFTVPDLYAVLCLDQIPSGAIVQVSARPRETRRIDWTIAEVAAARDGVWSRADHSAARPDDWPKFIAFHQRRLDALAQEGVCTRLEEGRFAIPQDFSARALSTDIQKWGPAELKLEILDDRTLDEQVISPGLTWLDRLMGPDGRPSLAGPFGEAVKTGLEARAAALTRTQFFSGDPLVLSERDLQRLLAFECQRVLQSFDEDGREIFPLQEGQCESGLYVARVHIAGRPYAVLKGESATVLAPWKRGMESCRNGAMEAALEGGQVSFRSLKGAERRLALGEAL